jgi:hypothetical protein
MKLKELYEASTHEDAFSFVVEINFAQNILNELSKIEDKIKSHFLDKHSLKIEFSNSTAKMLAVNVEITKEMAGNNIKLKAIDLKVFDELTAELRDWTPLGSHSYIEYFCEDKVSPNIKLAWRRVQISFSSVFSSFKNIDKILSFECIELVFQPHSISNTVLPLLKCPVGLRLVSARVSSNSKWLEIVKSHMKDRDILTCQEELIEAGYKEYAKL